MENDPHIDGAEAVADARERATHQFARGPEGALRAEPLVDVAAAVAHEVANAVSAIAGWAELGIEGGTDPRKALALIASCARTAEGAARRMLRLARGASVEEEFVCLDVSELTGELVQLLSITARQARVDLDSELDPGLSLNGSREQWFSVLWNLVKNAIEASPANARVHVTLRGDDVGVELAVRDEGPGLDEAAQSQIFTPFVTTKRHGTGLGLHLVREAVEALGGHLVLRSSPGQGSTFRVRMPRAASAARADARGLQRNSEVQLSSPLEPELGRRGAPPSDIAVRATASTLSEVRILVVDDDDALREMLATALGLRGARVTAVRRAEEARLQAGPFDAALIDMTLEDQRGDELLAQLRKRGSVSAAMLVTGTAQTPRLVLGGEPDDWVRKPFEVGELVERLKRTLERHQMLHAAAASMRR